MMKKLVALLMALALLCSSIGVFAEEEPAVEPVESAVDADDDVPKTGDTATVAYLIGAAMVLAAAYLLLRRRVHSK